MPVECCCPYLVKQWWHVRIKHVFYLCRLLLHKQATQFQLCKYIVVIIAVFVDFFNKNNNTFLYNMYAVVLQQIPVTHKNTFKISNTYLVLFDRLFRLLSPFSTPFGSLTYLDGRFVCEKPSPLMPLQDWNSTLSMEFSLEACLLRFPEVLCGEISSSHNNKVPALLVRVMYFLPLTSDT